MTEPSPPPGGSASRTSSSRPDGQPRPRRFINLHRRRRSRRLRGCPPREPLRDLVVETFITGNDYRRLVIGGKVAAIAERVLASVVGDGKKTVRELVEVTTCRPAPRHRPREGPDADQGRRRRRGGRPEPGLPARRRALKGTWFAAPMGNMSTGGTSIDRTIEAHPDNVEIAEMAARVVGLDVAYIDFICLDITVPVRETGGAIVEVNAALGFRMYNDPDRGRAAVRRQARDRPAVPAGRAGLIPILAVTGTNGKTTTVRMIAHILKLMGRRVEDLDRRHRGGRADDPARRHVRPEVGPDDPPEPDGRHGGVRGGARRDPPRGPRVRPGGRRGHHQRDRGSPRARRHRDAAPTRT